MLPEYFALVGSSLVTCAGLYYAYLTFRGRVQPNRMTWFFWALFPLIAFLAQISQGVETIAWATFIAALEPGLVLVASFFSSKAYWKIQNIDYIFAGVAIVAVMLWQMTGNANIALVFAILADVAVTIPTIIKTYRFPETESWSSYGLAAFGFSLGVLSIHIWTFENYAFVLYVSIMNILIAILALRPSTQIPKTENTVIE